MPTKYGELRKLWIQAVRAGMYAHYVPARMGRLDPGPAYTFDVPGGHGLTYIRVESGETVTLAHAWNRAGVSETGDLKIWADKGVDGIYTIIGERYDYQ